MNTIFAQLISKVGVRNVKAMAHHLGITEQVGGPYFRQACAITLGSVGFTPLEMTDVYATFASGGVHHDPQAFESVREAKREGDRRLQHQGYGGFSARTSPPSSRTPYRAWSSTARAPPPRSALAR